MNSGIEKIKRIAQDGAFRFVALKDKDGNTVVSMNRAEKDFEKKMDKIIHLLNSGNLSGKFTVTFKTACGTNYPGLSENIYIGGEQTEQEKPDPITQNTMEREQEMQLREELVKLRLENEQLKREIEETPLNEAPDNGETIKTIAETVKTLLSEFVVPIVSKAMEQRERRIVALEAAAAATARPVAIAPSRTFQVRPGYTPPVRPIQVPPQPGAASGVNPSPGQSGGGGQQGIVLPDGITESEYMEAIKHLTFDELVQYYNEIKATGKKIDLSFFLAVVREVRPDDLMILIESDLKKDENE